MDRRAGHDAGRAGLPGRFARIFPRYSGAAGAPLRL